MRYFVKRLIIDSESEHDRITARVRENLPSVPVTVVPNARDLVREEPVDRASLVLMRQRGAFIKEFPVPRSAPPCGEKYIKTMLNCPFSCSYCYLRSYLDHRRLVIFTNVDDLTAEIETLRSSTPPVRLTTGELGDSLALDHLTGITGEILAMLGGSAAVLDVRTKSDRVDHLLHAPNGVENLVITWTMGPEDQIDREEPGTATLEERCGAMRRAAGSGIPVGVRFDPIIPYYADIASYRSVLGKIASSIAPSSVHRFELGTVRFPPGLWECIRNGDPGSPLLRGEYFRDREGTIRFYRPARVALYRELVRTIESVFPDAAIELSMEDRTIWEDAGLKPAGEGE
jgi:spore photoproduct lyase